ncbi:MAG TPA: hypothetical protein VK756_06400 [Solirubrobacteraceae bacterium]|nr:hypothetical protein [Solirubrobacteraceae bacterium]
MAPGNPFVFQRPVDDLIDREVELQRLLDLAEGAHFMRLSAPRRYGKTTLIRRLRVEAERQLDMTTIVVDFSRVLSLGDVTVRIEDAYRRATDGPVRRAVRTLMRSWNLGVSLGAGGIAAKLEAEPKTDPLPALHRLLELPREAFERTGHRVLVAFDEFHEVLRLDGLDGLIRSHVQHHGEAASYLFAGSEPGLMNQLFGERERPLFGQAAPVRLGELPTEALGAHIERRFAETGRVPGEALDALLELVRGHPQRAMLMAHYLWEHTPPQEPATLTEWVAALDEVIDSLAEGFERFLDVLPGVQVRVLFALALSSHGLSSNYTQARFGLPTGSAAHDARDALVHRGEVLTDPYRITDPLLRYWLRQRRRPPGPDELE